MELEFSAVMFTWRGPAPFHFVALPDDLADDVKAEAGHLTYGWGMIPVIGWVGDTRFTTAMWPKDGGYYVPIKDAVRRAEQLDVGDEVPLRLLLEE